MDRHATLQEPPSRTTSPPQASATTAPATRRFTESAKSSTSRTERKPARFRRSITDGAPGRERETQRKEWAHASSALSGISRHLPPEEKTMALPATRTSRTIAVTDVMHAGAISCPPETPFHEIATLMSEHTAHCVVVDGWRGAPMTAGDWYGAPSRTSISCEPWPQGAWTAKAARRRLANSSRSIPTRASNTRRRSWASTTAHT
jgi:hypothetical protein